MKKGNSFIAILLGIFVLILIFELLITFKAVPIPSFPGLPKLFTNKNRTIPGPTPTPLPFAIYCPTLLRPCNFKYMYKGNQYAGMGFRVPDNSPILSIFSGQIIFTNKDPNSSIKASVVGNGKNKDYNANYNFIGGAIGKEISRGITYGEPIGTASAGSLIDYKDSKGINLILQLIDPKGYTVILSPSDFQR